MSYLIIGPKACGKTTIAKNLLSKSIKFQPCFCESDPNDPYSFYDFEKFKNAIDKLYLVKDFDIFIDDIPPNTKLESIMNRTYVICSETFKNVEYYIKDADFLTISRHYKFVIEENYEIPIKISKYLERLNELDLNEAMILKNPLKYDDVEPSKRIIFK